MENRQADPLVRGEETWRHPSPRLLVMRRTEVGVVTAVAAVTAGAWAGTAAVWIGVVVAIGICLCGLLVERFIERRIRAWGYCEREDDLLVRRGVLFARLSVVPYGRMQFIDVTAGPVERSFSLATVRMHTAAAASDARIPGLGLEDANELRDHLAALGEARAAGL